jgi:hypothetical protein
MSCLNLLELFGDKYRITFNCAYTARGVPRDKWDSWMMQIPCREGIVIYPHGGTTLAVELTGHRNLVKVLAALGLKLWQDGDRDRTFLFDVSMFPQVAAIVKPHRLPPALTQEQREAVRQRLAPYAFGSVEGRPKKEAG